MIDDEKAREHDGTNFRGLTQHCRICGCPLIGASELEVCSRCINRAGESLREKLDTYRRNRAGGGKP